MKATRGQFHQSDGWAPLGLRTPELGELLAQARGTEAWSRRTSPLDVILQNEHPLDPLGEPERVAEQLRRFSAIGATAVNVRFVHHSRAHYLEQAEALVEVTSSV